MIQSVSVLYCEKSPNNLKQWLHQSLYNTAVRSLILMGFLLCCWWFLFLVLRSPVVQNVLQDVFALTRW